MKAIMEIEGKTLKSVGNESLQSLLNDEIKDLNSTHQKNKDQARAVLSVSELAEYLGVSTDSLYTMVRENQIPYVRIRRRILFHRESINSWIQAKNPEQ
jgi:excisionase family DNA binding protein